MGYAHIENLYRNKLVMMFRECYALEKIHGTSAHISFKRVLTQDGAVEAEVKFFSGGEKYENFVALFDQEALKREFLLLGPETMIVYGEAYGGKCQGMKDTYGPNLKFVAFDVLIGDRWLGVEAANGMVTKLGLEFVAWNKVSTDPASLDAERDLPSRQAVRNGITEPRMAEGVVLRPPIEVTTNNGARIVAKHKRPEFSERASKKDTSLEPGKMELLAKAEDIASEWVVPMRLEHVLDKLKGLLGREVSTEDTRTVINFMVEDITREAKGEIVESREAMKAISTATAKLFLQSLRKNLVAP